MAAHGAEEGVCHFGGGDSSSVSGFPGGVFLAGGLDLTGTLPYLLGGLAGGLLSGKLFDKVPVTLLRRVLGVLILYGGVRAVLLL